MKRVFGSHAFGTVRRSIYVVLALLPITLVFSFVATYGPNVPIADNWWDPVWIAAKARSGTLTLTDMFVNVVGHRPVVIRSFAALWTLLSDYNMAVAKFLGAFNALVNLVLVSVIARRLKQPFLALFVVAASLIFFTLHHSLTWLDIYYSQWYQSVLFLLLGIIAILYLHVERLWSALLLAAGCAVCATFSVALGLAVWPALTLVIFSRESYWRLKFVLTWLALAVACVAIYNSSLALAPGDTSTTRNLQNLVSFAYLKFVGYTLSFQTIRFNLGAIWFPAKLFALVVLVVTTFNIALLWRRNGQIPWVWIGCGAYAVCGALVVALGRGVSSFPERYGVASDMFWIAIMAISITAIAAAIRRTPVPHSKWIVGVNVTLMVVFLGLTIYSNLKSVQAEARSTGRALFQVPTQFPEDICVRQYPLQRNECFRAYFVWAHEQSVYHLAALRLSLFSRDVPQSFLPAEYPTGSPVVAVSPNRWLSVYVRDWMLPNVGSDRLYHIAPEMGQWEKPAAPASPYFMPEVPVARFTRPLTNAFFSAEHFFQAVSITSHSQIWVIATPESAVEAANLDAGLRAAGYESTNATRRPPRYTKARFTLLCYHRAAKRSCPVH